MKEEIIKSAVIMAAGLGSRMRPLTERIPKPLADINGVPLIETSIKAMKLAGIDRIAVITGYLGEQFSYLSEKYDGISIIFNENYDSMNNISSIYAAFSAGFLNENSYICEGDLFISDPNIFESTMPSFNSKCVSAYFAKSVDENEYDDWGFITEENTLKIKKIKGAYPAPCSFGMTGISVFHKNDLPYLKKKVFEMIQDKDEQNRFWDEAVDSLISDGMEIFIKHIPDNSVIEIDTVSELEEIRHIYLEKNI